MRYLVFVTHVEYRKWLYQLEIPVVQITFLEEMLLRYVQEHAEAY